MSTLFQLHATINTLKLVTKDMAPLWQPEDCILLLGETAAYIDWLGAYIEDINHDDETEYTIQSIQTVYLLQDDIAALNDSAKIALDFKAPKPFTVEILSDEQWVALTQRLDKVVTLTAAI